MSFKVPQHSPYHRNSPNHSYSNDQGRNTSFNSPHMTASSSVPAWGSPAVGYSPRGNRPHKSPYNQCSPRGNHFQTNGQYSQSPRGHNNSQNRHYNCSPRNKTPNMSQNRFSSPNEVFKTPQSPLNRSYSSPASYNSFNSSGKRPFNQRFDQVHFSEHQLDVKMLMPLLHMYILYIYICIYIQLVHQKKKFPLYLQVNINPGL